MVSKIIALSLLAALAGHVNAYGWLAQIRYDGLSPTTIHYKITPIDFTVLLSEAVVGEADAAYGSSAVIALNQYNYGVIEVKANGQLELAELLVTNSDGPTQYHAPCALIDKAQYGPDPATAFYKKAFGCGGTVFYGWSGLLPPPPTTTTCSAATITVPVTVTVPVVVTTTTTVLPNPSPTCLAGYLGNKKSQGPNGACCSTTKDCVNKCVKGVCSP